MRAQLNFVTFALVFVLLVFYAIVLYSDFFEPLRSVGIPVPYCTTLKLALSCKYSFLTSSSVVSSIASGDLVVSIRGWEDPDLVNTLCNLSLKGRNVLALVDVVDSADGYAEQLSSCGVKVRRAPVSDTVLVSQNGLIIYTKYGSLFTDCKDVVGRFYNVLRGEWEHA